MQKLNVRMYVQYNNESAAMFAKRLEDLCEAIVLDNQMSLNGLPTISLTSDGNGRQTATIQYITTKL